MSVPKKQILALLDRYEEALRNRDAAACASFYDEDAIYLTCGTQPVRGREPIKSLHESMLGAGFELINLSASHVEAEENLGYGTLIMDSRKESMMALIVFGLDDNRNWKIRAEAEISLSLHRHASERLLSLFGHSHR